MKYIRNMAAACAAAIFLCPSQLTAQIAEVTSYKVLVNRYGWHLKSSKDGKVALRDSARLAQLEDIASMDSALIPYTYTPTSISNGSYSRCKTIRLVYKRYADYELAMEIDLPQGEGPFPFMFFVHGGGWGGGTLKVYEPHSCYFASHGIAGVRISYSLMPCGATFAQVRQEIKDALQYVRAHADSLRLDVNRWGLTGSSAGAHLGAIAALDAPDCKLFIGSYGAYDLTRSRPDNFPSKDLCRQYLGDIIADTLRQASAALLIPNRPLPKMLLMHGTTDLTINVEQTRFFASELRSKHAEVEEIYYPGYEHSFINPGVTDIYESVLKKMLAFTREVLTGGR